MVKNLSKMLLDIFLGHSPAKISLENIIITEFFHMRSGEQFSNAFGKSQEKEFGKIREKFGETRSEKYVVFGGTFAEFFRILFGKFVWMSSKFGFDYEVLL
jgi:hypothetical protein